VEYSLEESTFVAIAVFQVTLKQADNYSAVGT
jgi:hypothetical protein